MEHRCISNVLASGLTATRAETNDVHMRYSWSAYTRFLRKNATCCVDVVNYKQHLTNWSQVMHMCVNKLGYHWCWQRLVACSAPSHNLKQYLIIVNCNVGNKLQWHYCQNNQPSFCENAFRNAECKKLAFSSGPQYVKSRCQASLSRPVDEMACLKHANFDQIPIDQYFVTNDG